MYEKNQWRRSSQNVITDLVFLFNTSPPEPFGGKIADYISKCIFFNEMIEFQLRFHFKFVRKVPTDNKLALVRVMAWHRAGDKPLHEPMLTQFIDAYMRH